MTAFAALTLQNNAAANVTFTPGSIDSAGIARWYGSGSVLDARPTVTFKVSNPPKGSNVARVSGKVTIPIMDAVNPQLKTAEMIGSFELVMPKQTTETQRLDLRKLVDTLLQNAVTTAGVQFIESVY